MTCELRNARCKTHGGNNRTAQTPATSPLHTRAQHTRDEGRRNPQQQRRRRLPRARRRRSGAGAEGSRPFVCCSAQSPAPHQLKERVISKEQTQLSESHQRASHTNVLPASHISSAFCMPTAVACKQQGVSSAPPLHAPLNAPLPRALSSSRGRRRRRRPVRRPMPPAASTAAAAAARAAAGAGKERQRRLRVDAARGDVCRRT